MENKDIVEALEKAPELVKAAETFKETSGHIISSFANAIKKRPQAEIPESELQKISQTPCAPPDVDSFSKALVQKVAGDIGSTIKEKVDEALEGATVKVQHTHSYCIEKDLKEFADIRLWNRSIAFGLVSVVLVAIIVIIAIVHFNSEAYWGKQYLQVANSEYVTEDEWDLLWEDVYPKSLLPKEYMTNPSRVKSKIRENKKIIKQRQRKGKDKNGDFSSEVSLER